MVTAQFQRTGTDIVVKFLHRSYFESWMLSQRMGCETRKWQFSEVREGPRQCVRSTGPNVRFGCGPWD